MDRRASWSPRKTRQSPWIKLNLDGIPSIVRKRWRRATDSRDVVRFEKIIFKIEFYFSHINICVVVFTHKISYGYILPNNSSKNWCNFFGILCTIFYSSNINFAAKFFTHTRIYIRPNNESQNIPKRIVVWYSRVKIAYCFTVLQISARARVYEISRAFPSKAPYKNDMNNFSDVFTPRAQ